MEKGGIRNVFFLSVVFLVWALFAANAAMADDTIYLVSTWSAQNFYPADYAGKSLPSKSTPVRIAVEVVKNNRIIDASDVLISWYVDNKFLSEGRGLKEITFRPTKRAGDSHFIKITASIDGQVVIKFVEIPIVAPEVVVEYPYRSNGIVPSNAGVVFVAMPYFFNVQSFSDLVTSWKVGNTGVENAGKNSLFVQFGEPSEALIRDIKVAASVAEKNNPFNMGKYSFSLTVEKSQ